MINVTLRQLRYFDALAHHRHFGRAADACAVSQPALSMQIREMEQAVGGVLIERNARQVTLTTFGEDLLRRVRDILRSVDELGDFARASRDKLAGRLRVGMIPTVAPYLLPKVIENLARLHPELDIHVRETLTPKLIKEVAEGRLDTAIVALPVSEPSLTEVALFSENFLLVRPGEDAKTPVPSAAPVTVSPFKHPQPSRTIGMVWRKTSPLAAQLQQISEVVSLAARALRAPKQDGAKEPAKRTGRRKVA